LHGSRTATVEGTIRVPEIPEPVALHERSNL
jgi:hypothetical protein